MGTCMGSFWCLERRPRWTGWSGSRWIVPVEHIEFPGEVAVVVSWLDMVPGGTKAGKLHSYPVSARTWYEETRILA